MTFTPRLSAPEKTGWYGNEMNAFGRRNEDYGMPNCTAYAWGRASELLQRAFELWHGDARTWWQQNVEREWLPYGDTPALGSIIVFDAVFDNPCGHVAVVEAIDGNVITISQSHYEQDKERRDNRYWDTITFDYIGEKPYGDILGFIYVINEEEKNNMAGTWTYEQTNGVIGALYNGCFGRQFTWGENEGLQNDLMGQTTRAEAFNYLLTTPEHQRYMLAHFAYRTMRNGENPDDAELRQWIESDLSNEDMVKAILYSDEFNNRYNV